LADLHCSGRFIHVFHVSGHPLAAGRAQDKERSPAKDRSSTTVLRNQPERCYLPARLFHSFTPGDNHLFTVADTVLWQEEGGLRVLGPRRGAGAEPLMRS